MKRESATVAEYLFFFSLFFPWYLAKVKTKNLYGLFCPCKSIKCGTNAQFSQGFVILFTIKNCKNLFISYVFSGRRFCVVWKTAYQSPISVNWVDKGPPWSDRSLAPGVHCTLLGFTISIKKKKKKSAATELCQHAQRDAVAKVPVCRASAHYSQYRCYRHPSVRVNEQFFLYQFHLTLSNLMIQWISKKEIFFLQFENLLNL